MRTWADVAEIGKAKTLDGGLVVHNAAGLPFLLSEGMRVAFVPPRSNAPREAVVASVKQMKDRGFLVYFDTVPDIGTAERLVGCRCLVKRVLLPPDFDSPKGDPRIGLEVVDASFGKIGQVSGYIDGAMQSLFEVEGGYGDVLIPDVPEFIVEVDLDAGRLSTRIPPGLLDLAQGRGPKGTDG